jgi:hypothetical protein
MAVICEDPKVFGFDVECPLGGMGETNDLDQETAAAATMNAATEPAK